MTAVAGLAALIWGISFYYQNLRGIGPAIKSPSEDISKIILSATSSNSTNFPLKLPPGFSIEIFAKDLPGARVIKFDSSGNDKFANMWVSQTSEGTITRLDIKDGKVINQTAVFTNLKKPHGLAFDPEFPRILYFAEENKISYIDIQSTGQPRKIIDLPYGAGHFTRTIGFGPAASSDKASLAPSERDNRLYVSIGSSCNVCHESDDRRAKIFSMKPDGSDLKEFARGLRNTVFFTWYYVTDEMWGTDMGRDLLGDDTPPDEINIIKERGNYGWPICYGKNIHDTDFEPVKSLRDNGAGKNTDIRNPCMEPFESGSHIDTPAHSAPLGIAFIPEEGWPEKYWYDAIIAYHGSWNRSVPTGYKLARIPLDAYGNQEGPIQDFISGWLKGGTTLGRPVDILIQPGGKMYVSDDHAGVIYKIALIAEP